MEVLEIKIILIVAIIALTLCFAVLPYFLILRGTSSLVQSVSRREKILACLNSFSGGVFLGILLFNIMIEGEEEFESYKKNVGWNTEFPFFSLFVGLGFFIVCIIELIMHGIFHDTLHEHPTTPQSPNVAKHPEIVHIYQQAESKRYGTFSASYEERQKHLRTHFHSERNAAAVPVQSGATTPNPVKPQASEPTSQDSLLVPNSNIEASPTTGVETRRPSADRTFLLLIALSVHTIFDGLVVGIQEKSSQLWSIFGGVSLHKIIIAFCLGLEIFKHFAGSPCKAFLWMFLFSLMAPIGIFIGLMLTSEYVEASAKMLSSSILQGIAAGMFLYVTFLEILSVYIGRHSHNSFGYVMLALLGFGVVAASKAVELATDAP